MAGRGSGIGLGLQGGFGAVGGPSASTRPAAAGQVYGPTAKQAQLSSLKTYHYLWALVGIEIVTLVFLRAIVFRPYHGG